MVTDPMTVLVECDEHFVTIDAFGTQQLERIDVDITLRVPRAIASRMCSDGMASGITIGTFPGAEVRVPIRMNQDEVQLYLAWRTAMVDRLLAQLTLEHT